MESASSGGHSDGEFVETNSTNLIKKINASELIEEITEKHTEKNEIIKMISTRKCSACVAISRWLVISVFLLIVTTASAVGVSNAADTKQANNFQMNGASNDDLRVSADHNS